MILSQQKLIQQLRDYDINVSSTTIHAWVRSGCPLGKEGFNLLHPCLRRVLDTAQQPYSLLQVIQGLCRDGLVDRSRHTTVPEVAPKGLAGLRGGVGLDFHGHLLGYQEWRTKSECQASSWKD